MKTFSREEWMKIFEALIEHENDITSSPAFRRQLNRDQKLAANQITREATNNVAYRSVDFDLNGLSDDEIWEKLDNSRYNELIQDNAAAQLMKMVEKLDLA